MNLPRAWDIEYKLDTHALAIVFITPAQLEKFKGIMFTNKCVDELN